MILANQISQSEPLAWTGVQTSWPAGFQVLLAEHVYAKYTNAAGVVTELTRGTHFGVSLDGSNNVTAVPLAMPAAPGTIVFRRRTPPMKQIDLADLTNYPATVHDLLYAAAELRDMEIRNLVEGINPAYLEELEELEQNAVASAAAAAASAGAASGSAVAAAGSAGGASASAALASAAAQAAQAAAYTFWGGTDTGTASALVFAVTPAITSYVIGGIYKGTIGAGHTNTASASANFGGGPRNIKLPSGDAIPAAALIAGQTYAFLYTGTNFIALNPTFGIGLRAGEVVVAAATTTDILGAASEYIGISGAGVNITSFGTGPNRRRVIYFAGANTIVHNNAAIICPGKQDMPVAAGDCLIVESSASSVARIVSRTALIGDRFDTFDVGAIINVDYTMLPTDRGRMVLCIGGTSRTITLPAASAAAAWSVFPVHNISSVPFTVQRAGGDGLTNYAGGSLILQPGEGMLFYTDGASTWRMLGLESPDYLGRRGAPDIIIEDQKSSGTAGGTFTSGADRTRDLNTIVADPFGYCSVASNQFTLQPGTWYLKWSAPALKCANHQSHLYNVTGAAVQQRGSTEFTGNSSGNTTNRSMGSARFTIAVATTFEIRHRCTTTESSDGFGQSASYGTEVYTRVEGWKIK